ncbi:MAG: hypothetical protein ACR2IT_07695 [Pirellulales bacterium]
MTSFTTSARERRRAIASLAAALGCVVCFVLLAESASAVTGFSTSLWECNYCHQQYQGNQPPAFAKCPAKEMKQNHWWIKKSN